MNADRQSSVLPTVDLSFFQEVGLIICRPSGVLYTNQAAGLKCMHPEVEGVFYPLPVKPGRSELYALTQHFKGPGNALTEEDARFVDSVLRRNGHTFLKVNRAGLNDSYEAWIHVNITSGGEPLGAPFSGFAECEGVLTWPNSD